MKSKKLLAGIFAGAVLLTTGCQEETKSGEDSSKAVPTDLSYVTLTSKDAGDTLALRWNAQALIAQGATSFSVEICDDPAEPVNTYDDVIQTIKSSEIKGGTGVVYFTKGISEYTEKYARIRANYGSVFSKWAFATDGKGQPAVFVAGHGIKDLDKASVGAITVTDCPADGNNFTIKADLTPASSASRILAILMDYAAQKSLETIEVNPSSSTFEHKFEDLTSGKLYQVKMLAEYDVEGQATHVADWAFAEGEAKNDETGEMETTKVIQCGKGFVVVNGVPPTVKLVNKLSGQLVFQWTEYGFDNIAKDAAIPVKVALYKDEACKDLLYGWTIDKYQISGRQPTIAFSNLEPNTKYWFVCQDTATGLISDALEATTAAFDIVTVGATKAKAGEYAVSENFGELYFGGYAMDFSPSPGNNNVAMPHPETGKWDAATLVWTDGNHGFFNTLGKSGAVKNSRFKDWGVIHGLQNGTGAAVPGDLCIRTGMFQMGASSGIPILCTPELTNLEGLATVKVTFSASSMWEKGAIKENTDADFQNIAVYTVSGGNTNYTVGTDYGTITGATVKEAGVVTRPAGDVKTPTWETKTVTVKNVSPGTRIGLGAVRGKTGNQRWLLNAVQVQVVSYGVPKLTTPVLKSKEVKDVSAKFTFEAQDMAQTYSLEYKKTNDENYTTLESETPEFELSGLEMGTEYVIRVAAKAGDYSSDYYYYVFKTEVITPAVPEIDQTATEVKATSVNLVWNAAENALSYIVSYKQKSASDWTEVTSTTNSALIKGLKDNTVYEFRVASVRSNKVSDFSNTVEFTTPEISWEYPLAINDAETFASWLTSGAEFTAAGNVVNINANIDLSGVEFTPAAAFAGTLNGNNHSIKLAGSTGLFEKFSGEVSNLTIEGSVKATLEENSTDGHPLAAFANISTGKITNCTNKASVSMTSTGVLGSPVVAGLVAFQQGGTFTGNTNTGAVSLSHGGSAHVTVSGFNRKPFTVAAGVVGVIVKTTAENCTNEGAVKVLCTNVANNASRQYIGGVIGTPEDAVVKNCTNKGDVTGDFTDAAHSASKQYWVGGIIGGRNGDVTTVDGAQIEGCQNYGTLTLIADNNVNNYIGGIGAQPSVENPTSISSEAKKIVDCHNYGKIVKKGVGGGRIGGVSGGAATLDKCSNEGEISIENISASGAVGGLVGYPTQTPHTIENCTSTGNLTSKATTAFAIGGIGGQAGNTVQTWSGCTVNCTISGQSANLAGMVVGTGKTLTKAVTLGTADAPIKVSGTINGTAITADNLAKYISGDGAAVNGKISVNSNKGSFDATYVVYGK